MVTLRHGMSFGLILFLTACSGFPSNQVGNLASVLVLTQSSTSNGTSAGAGSGATGSTGPFVFNSGWACGVGVDCQDVYDFVITNPIAADGLTVAVTAITGNSAIRLAVFGPGSALNGTNLINGGTTDHRCVAFDTNDSVTVNNQTTTGTYRVAIGRDNANSAGTSGTYSLSVSLSAAKLASSGQTVNDTATLLNAATTCP